MPLPAARAIGKISQRAGQPPQAAPDLHPHPLKGAPPRQHRPHPESGAPERTCGIAGFSLLESAVRRRAAIAHRVIAPLAHRATSIPVSPASAARRVAAASKRSPVAPSTGVPPGWGATLATRPGKLDTAVSIRAPGWGATREDRRRTPAQGFQSAPPGGGRLIISEPAKLLYMFQSAPPGGGRLASHCGD